MKKPVVGVVGLGNMGGGIARTLLRANVPLTVWDVDEDARLEFIDNADVQICPPGQMAKQCKLMLFVVPGSQEIRACLNGKNGVLAQARSNLVLCDLTTSDPKVTLKLAKRAATKDVFYLDAGMSGGASGAEAGKLTLMVGGDVRAYKRATSFFEIIAAKIFYLGESGAGHTMKLVHNMVCHSIFLATAEGARMAEKAGITLKDAIDVFNAGNARSYISEARFPNHILSETWDAKSRIHNLHKDVGMAVDISQNLGHSSAIGEQTARFLDAAINLGMSETDFSRLYQNYDRISKSAVEGE